MHLKLCLLLLVNCSLTLCGLACVSLIVLPTVCLFLPGGAFEHTQSNLCLAKPWIAAHRHLHEQTTVV